MGIKDPPRSRQVGAYLQQDVSCRYNDQNSEYSLPGEGGNEVITIEWKWLRGVWGSLLVDLGHASKKWYSTQRLDVSLSFSDQSLLDW